MKIIFNFASRSRPEKFFAALDNIRSLAEGEYEVIAKLDSDDLDMNNSDVSEKLKQYPEVKVCWGMSENKVHAINRGIEGEEFSIMIVMSDDVLFTEKGFDKRIIQDMQKYFPTTDGCLWYNDGTPNGHKIMTVAIIGRKFYEITNYVYFPDFWSVYCDDHQTRYAKSLNRIKYFPGIIFRHKHWLFNFSQKDELNARNDSDMVYAHDRRVYLKHNPVLFLNYATRGRPEMFFDAMDNIQNTISTEYYKIVVKADSDDVTMNNNSVRQRLQHYKNVSIVYDFQTSKIGAINRQCEFAGDWSWMACMSDDQKFIVNGWDELMLNDIRSVWGDSLDFFSHFNDGFVGEKLPTLSVMGLDYYNRFGYTYHPSYGSISADAEQMFVAMMLGKHHYFPNIYFKHIHPANVPSIPVDHIYRMNDKWGLSDVENYFTRRARLFDVKDPLTIPFNPLVRE